MRKILGVYKEESYPHVFFPFIRALNPIHIMTTVISNLHRMLGCEYGDNINIPLKIPMVLSDGETEVENHGGMMQKKERRRDLKATSCVYTNSDVVVSTIVAWFIVPILRNMAENIMS